jgi:YD repeat-containing protein
MVAVFTVWIGLAPAESLAAGVPGETYAYDALGRLVLVTNNNGTQTAYTYDAAGNRTLVQTATASADAPVANNASATTTAGASPTTISPSFSDPNGLSVSIVQVGAPLYGSASIVGSSVQYFPPSAGSSIKATDVFTYTVRNSSGYTASASISVVLN